MKRVRSNYHALHRDCVIINSKKELVNYISVCVLNVLNCNIKLSVCNTRKLQKYKAALRNVTARHVALSGKKRLVFQHEGFLLPLLGAILPTTTSLIHKFPARNIKHVT